MRTVRGVEVIFSASCGHCGEELSSDGDSFQCEECGISYDHSGSEAWADDWDGLVCGHPAARELDTRPLAELPPLGEGPDFPTRPQYLVDRRTYEAGPPSERETRHYWVMWRYISCQLPHGHKGDHLDVSHWVSDRDYEAEWALAHREDERRAARADGRV